MNAKSPEVIEKFLQLCAQDCSLKSIAKELGVSRTTLVQWTHKYAHLIANYRTLETDELTQKHKLSRRHCIEQLGCQLQLVYDEISRRKLDDVPTARLYVMAAQLRAEAAQFNGALKFSAPVPANAPPEEQYPDPIATWEI